MTWKHVALIGFLVWLFGMIVALALYADLLCSLQKLY